MLPSYKLNAIHGWHFEIFLLNTKPLPDSFNRNRNLSTQPLPLPSPTASAWVPHPDPTPHIPCEHNCLVGDLDRFIPFVCLFSRSGHCPLIELQLMVHREEREGEPDCIAVNTLPIPICYKSLCILDSYCTGSLSHLRTMLPESSSCPQPVQ